MPQELHVVRCFNCETFQSDIVKKVRKWTCKLCNSKQSLQKVYFEGTGKGCRLFAQEMNRRRFKGPNNLQAINKLEGNRHDDEVKQEIPVASSSIPKEAEKRTNECDSYTPKSDKDIENEGHPFKKLKMEPNSPTDNFFNDDNEDLSNILDNLV